MPKVANYFVRPEGVTLTLATVKDVQYGEGNDEPKPARGGPSASYGPRVRQHPLYLQLVFP